MCFAAFVLWSLLVAASVDAIRLYSAPLCQSCAFVLAPGRRTRARVLRASELSREWSVADDWDRLSSENSPVDTSDIFNVDLARDAALSMARGQEGSTAAASDPDEAFVADAVECITNPMPDGSDPPLFDTLSSLGEYAESGNFVDDAGREIGLLVRCNERPEDLLVAEGRALPPLADEERHDPSQLVTATVAASTTRGAAYEPTEFLRGAVLRMFREHAVTKAAHGDDELVMDAVAVAKWMSKCLRESVGRHEKRVLSTISRYGSYGSGVLTAAEFERLYVDAVIAGMDGWKTAGRAKKASWKGIKAEDEPGIQGVWRDLTNHDILSPAEAERKRLEEEMTEKYGDSAVSGGTGMSTLMDECEILEWGEHELSSPYFNIARDNSEGNKAGRKSSHQFVDMASDNATPKRIRDGQFVFIDEESCIGCAMCAQVAPSAFTMLDSGRARAYYQSNAPEVASAVASCPVSCMHNVAFHELKEFEVGRDDGDGRTDHRHFGQSRGHTPLNVAGIDSDANHKSSWYHYLKQNCHVSSGCPQRGCYDCPMYSAPGENPYFKKLHQKSEHLRAQDFISSGDADVWRKTAEL